MSQRIDRVDELLRQEIGRILAKDVQDPHIGFATVTDVETTPDLRHARVWVSVIGGAPERAETLTALERAMGYVRHELGVRLRIKRIPALHVALDDSAARGTRVLRIIEELGQGHDAAGEALADAPRAETLPTPVPRLHRDGDAEASGGDAETSDGEEGPPSDDITPVVEKTIPRRQARRASGRPSNARRRHPPRRDDR
jgi:ribosome-binding factor A